MQKSPIEWTDATWNPVYGCGRVSEGCRNCYAEGIARRFSGPGKPYEGLIASGGQWNNKITLREDKLLEPWRWVKPRRIFVNSMSDLFHESVPFDFIAAVFAVMSVTTRHTYQVLTKRPQRMLEFFEWAGRFSPSWVDSDIGERISDFLPDVEWIPATKSRGGYDNCGPLFPFENVWLGVSVEDQATADERIPLLLKAPAAVRFVSAEPLLGKIDLSHIQFSNERGGLEDWDALQLHGATTGCTAVLDWVIVGGESGRGARPMHPNWVRSLRDQCAEAAVPFFFKQWGEWSPVQYLDTEGNPLVKLVDDARETMLGGDGLPYANMRRVGKKLSGRSLDGRTHDAFPEVSV